jgi:uncharacterized protein involved in cysteine biosynthesis
MQSVPCVLCGYSAPSTPCPYCGGRTQGPSLAGAPPSRGMEFWTGLRAIPTGLGILVRGPGLKRCLVPPFVITCVIALLAFTFWIGPAVDWVFALAEAEGTELTWWERWLGAIADSWLFGWLHGISWFLAWALTVWLTFTLIYEALAGPFLDEIQGRIEARWFGRDPLERKDRPVDLPVAACAKRTLLFGGLGLALGATTFWFAQGWAVLLALPVFVAPLLVAGRLDPEYGKWLGWVAGREASLLWISIKVALLTGTVMLLFIWLPWIPVIGPPLYIAMSGFSLALGLLDIPLSRRGWGGRQRMAFLGAHLPAFAAYGIVGSFLIGIPLLGPLLAVPLLSIGGQWLVVRLDKTGLRNRALAVRSNK